MQNDYVAPVDHGVLSSTGSVVVGTARGAVKSFSKTLLWGIGIFGIAGAALAASALIGVVGPVGVAFGGLLGGLTSGLTLGPLLGSFVGAFSGVFGAVKGAIDAKDRVTMEKGAARSMEAQLAAYQSVAAANDNKYNLPRQGSRMNPAMSQINASSVDRSGTMIGQQLARA